MKKIYKVNNIFSEAFLGEGRSFRLTERRSGSRIGSINHRIWSVIAPILLVVFGLFGVNENAWATWPEYSGSITKSGSTYYVLNEGDGGVELMDGGSRTYDKTYNLGGPCSTLSFQLKKVNLGPTGRVYVYAGSSEVYSVGVGDFANKNNWKTFPDNPKDISSYCKNTTLRFHATGTLGKWLRYAKVTMFSGTLDPSTSSLQFGAADYNTTGSTSAYTQNFTIDWSNIASMSISGLDNTQFSATISNNSSAGKYGTATVTVTYKHDKVGTHNATLTIGGKSVSLSGTTNKINPYIVTKPTVAAITYGDKISNSQLGTGLVKADLINAAGTVVPGTWTIDENGQTVSTSGGQNATVHLTFTPSDQNTYNVIHTTQTMFVRSAATITWTSAYSAEKPTIPVGKTIENAASTNANGATVTYSTSDPDVIVIENEGTTFRAIAEGEATITASHGVTATHGSASISKTFKTTYKDIQVIVWTDRFDRLTTEMTSKNLLAQVWIENPVSGERTYSAARTALLEYSVEDNTIVSIPANSTTLTIHKKGNTTLTASVEGNDQYESASVTMEVKVRDPSAGCDDPLLLDIKNNGTNDYLYRLFSDDTKKPALYSDEYAIDVAQGQVPDKLSFGHKGEEYKVIGLSFWTYYSGTIKAQQKVNGNWVDVENSIVTPEKSQWHTKEGVQLDEGATHIRFVRPQGGEGYHYVKDVEVTMKHFIRTATPTVDFGNTIKVNSSEYKDVVINYSNAKGSLQVINPFTKDVTVSDDYIDIDECGAFGSDTLRISFSPTTATEIDDYIVVKDPVVGNSSALSIRVKADVQRADQTIKWNPETNISTIDQILLNGTTNGQEYGQMNIIGYEVTNNDGVISVTDGVVTILKPGTVTITASQSGTANYDVAEPVAKTFTITAETLTLVAPAAGDITYGQTLNESTLTGGSATDSKGNPVAGTFAWQNPDAVLNAGNNQTPNVVFTPSENAAWYTGLTTTTTINVAKADPVATVENVSFAYGTKAEDVSLVGTGAGTWSWTDSRKGETLTVGEYEMDVHFAPTDGDNYNAINTTITLTVTKADPEVTVENVSFAYGTKAEDVALNGTGAGTWSWADSRKGEVLAAGTYEMDVHFAPTDGDNYNAINTTITLIVTKADPEATVENVSFAYGTKAEDVALNGTGAGTWSWTDSRKGEVLEVDTYEMDVHFAPTDGDNFNVINTTITLTVTKADPTLSWSVAPTELAYNAAGVVYTATSASDGAITYSIINGGSYAHINANTGELTIDAPGHDITIQAAQAEGTNHNAPEAITIDVTIAAAPVNEYIGTGDWNEDENWSSGSKPEGENPDIIVTGTLVVKDTISVGSLTIKPTGGVVIIDKGVLVVNDATPEQNDGYGDLRVADDGALQLNEELKVRDFTLDAKLGDGDTQAASGQVDGSTNLQVNGVAYFQMSFDPAGAISYGWYDFTVPFSVNINGGISRVGSSDDRVMVSGTDFLIMEADEANRANGGKGWRTLNGGSLVPGKLYTITFNYQKSLPQNTFRFAWNKEGYFTNSRQYTAQHTEGSVVKLRGWNGMGNGMLRHGYIESGYMMQAYDHTNNKYDLVEGEKTFAVGSAFFIQVPKDDDMTINWTAAEETVGRPLFAPKREVSEVEKVILRLRDAETDKALDVLYMSASEEATEEYAIGRDFMKMGTMTESKVARMWATKGGNNLCCAEAILANDVADMPISLFTPNAGLFAVTLEQMPADANLYLTYNDEIIWDLTASQYQFELTQGTTEGYGLRVEVKKTPAVTTGVEDVQGDEQKAAMRKVLIDNKVYIVTPEGKMYNIIGKSVKY